MKLPIRMTAAVAVAGAALVAATAVRASAYPAPAPGSAHRPAVAGLANSSVRDVFDVEADHRVELTRFDNRAVVAEQDLGGNLTDGVGAALTPSGTEVVAGRGTDGAVWFRQRSGTGPWSGWRSLGGRITDDVSATQVGGVIVVAVRGTDGRLYERVLGPAGWSAHWRQVSSQLVGSPTVAAAPGGRFVAYVAGRDGQIWTTHRAAGVAGGWQTPWQPTRDSGFTSQLGVDTTGGDVLIRNERNVAVLLTHTDAGAVLLGGQFGPDGFAAITQSGDGKAQTVVYGHAPNGVLYQKVGNGGWTPVGD